MTATMPALDLRSQATYPIRLGASILKPSEASRFSSIRYNYKPPVQQARDASCVIRPGDNAGVSGLELVDADGQYDYTGKYRPTEESYVLLLGGQGKDKEMTLERVDNAHEYNLIRTPLEDDAADLAQQYPHLPVDDADEGDLFGDEDADAPPNVLNPFDYRHFLKAEAEKSASANKPSTNTKAAVSTPVARAQNSSYTPVSRPSTRPDAKAGPATKRKAPPAEKPATKRPKVERVKAGPEPPPNPAESSQARQVDIPKLRLDRKASIRRPSLDDGELIIENETPISEKPPRGAMALALSGQLRQGPISLRSAASSPASHYVASPQPVRPNHLEEDNDFELGGSSPEATQRGEQMPPVEEDDDADEEGAADEDVEDLELPSPMQVSRPSISAATVTGGEDEEDGLGEALALALAGSESGESEESEEE